MSSDRDARRVRWEERTRVPFLVLAFVYLIAWSIVVLDEDTRSVLWGVAAFLLIAIWLTFIVDYVVRLALAKPRRSFILSSVPDAVAALLPVFRPVVQLRHIANVPLLRNRGGAFQRVRIGVMTAAFAVVFVYSIALAVLVAERRSPDATITTFGEAIWWACVTMFTVGYGDYSPVTFLGRFWAVVLMIGGVAIIGVTSAIVVTYLGDRIRRHEGEAADGDGAAPGSDATPSVEQRD